MLPLDSNGSGVARGYISPNPIKSRTELLTTLFAPDAHTSKKCNVWANREWSLLDGCGELVSFWGCVYLG